MPHYDLILDYPRRRPRSPPTLCQRLPPSPSPRPILPPPPSPIMNPESRTLPNNPILDALSTKKITIHQKTSAHPLTFHVCAFPLARPPRMKRPRAVDFFGAGEKGRCTEELLRWVKEMAMAETAGGRAECQQSLAGRFRADTWTEEPKLKRPADEQWDREEGRRAGKAPRLDDGPQRKRSRDTSRRRRRGQAQGQEGEECGRRDGGRRYDGPRSFKEEDIGGGWHCRGDADWEEADRMKPKSRAHREKTRKNDRQRGVEQGDADSREDFRIIHNYRDGYGQHRDTDLEANPRRGTNQEVADSTDRRNAGHRSTQKDHRSTSRKDPRITSPVTARRRRSLTPRRRSLTPRRRSLTPREGAEHYRPPHRRNGDLDTDLDLPAYYQERFRNGASDYYPPHRAGNTRRG